MSDKMVFWAELQSGLCDAGLNVVVAIPDGSGVWCGLIDDKKFIMSISAQDDDGFRSFMMITLVGQDEALVVPALTKFMGYPPYARYLDTRIPVAHINFEWAKDAEERFVSLEEDDRMENLERLEEGFAAPVPPGPEQYFRQFTTENIENWRLAVEANPEVGYNGSKIADLLPFVETVMPRVGLAQSLLGFSIICLEGPMKDVAAIVAYGLEPLLKAEVIADADATAITKWFETTTPSWDGARNPNFSKQVTVGGKPYTIHTDSHRNYRDLNIHPA